jgi:excinuclease ABC subunit B
VNGRVIMYAEVVTNAMKIAMDETTRRRAVQRVYNTQHGIVPTTIVRAVMNINPASGTIDYFNVPKMPKGALAADAVGGAEDMQERLAAMRLEMFAAAENLDFEKATRLRDELKKLESLAGVAPPSAGAGGGFNPYSTEGKRKNGARAKGTAKAGGGARNGRKYKAR